MENSPNQYADAPVTEPDTADTPIKLRLIHPHVLISKAIARNDSKNNSAYAESNYYDNVDVRVSRTSFRLALAVMDRLFKALEQRELSISNGHDYHSRGTYACSGHHDKCPLYIEEVYRQVAHVPTAKEQADQTRFSTRIPKWDSVPTGKLTLHPGGAVDLTSQQAFDNLIQRAVDEVMKVIERARDERQKREAVQREQAERQRREDEEKKRVEAFYKSADALHRYRLTLEFIEEVRRFGRVPANQLRPGQTMEEWLEWAHARAREIHPLGF